MRGSLRNNKEGHTDTEKGKQEVEEMPGWWLTLSSSSSSPQQTWFPCSENPSSCTSHVEVTLAPGMCTPQLSTSEACEKPCAAQRNHGELIHRQQGQLPARCAGCCPILLCIFLGQRRAMEQNPPLPPAFDCGCLCSQACP